MKVDTHSALSTFDLEKDSPTSSCLSDQHSQLHDQICLVPVNGSSGIDTPIKNLENAAMKVQKAYRAGGATLAAGRLVVEDGVLKSVSPYSGHYRPTDDSFHAFLMFLKENGVNLDEVKLNKANEDSENYDDVVSSKFGGSSSNSNIHLEDEESLIKNDMREVPMDTSSLRISLPNGGFEDLYKSQTLFPQSRTGVPYKRTLSGGLQSPIPEVPKTDILQRINSKKAVKSWQLGNQVSAKWSTGVGPRIVCMADYPIELRLQALELTNLSPRRGYQMLETRRRTAFHVSPTQSPSADLNDSGVPSC